MKAFLVLCISLCLVEALVVPCNSPCLLVSIATQIRALDYNNVTSHPVISGLSRAVALDIHYSLGYIFWSDVTELNIKRANVDGSSIKVIHNNTGLCDGLAVEWNSSLLYWTDTTNNTISVSDLEGNNKRILVSSNLDKPRGIALDPNYGSMFWTDWGQTPKIERATLSGTQRVAIVTSNLQWPNGIDLDRRNRLLFWVDAGTDRVECIDYHGNNRKLLFQQSGIHVFGVTFLSSSLFFSEWATDGIYKINASLANGTIMSGLVFQGIDVVMGLVAYDSSRQSPVITCQALPAPSNGTRLGCPGNATMYYDTVCQFSCNNGFIGSGSKVRRCQHNGTWSGQDLTCQIVNCPALPLPFNSVRHGCTGNATKYPYDTVCRFSCIDGHKASGSSVRRCQENGLWNGGEFSCKRIICEPLQLAPNVRMNGSCTRLPGDACEFACERGYDLIGSNIRQCNSDGSWTGTQPRCEAVTCPTLSPPTNGELLGCNTTEILYDTVCRFSCKEGSEASGSTVRRCTENGTWSGNDLVCTVCSDIKLHRASILLFRKSASRRKTYLQLAPSPDRLE
ncbi:P-selectin-like isoform X2 [Oculina patagonica]